jgi:hypothetical protein
MLAHDEVEVGVVGEAVALVGGAHDLAHALAVPAAADVARHVGEQQVMIDRVPQRAFGEVEPGAQLEDGGVFVDQVPEGRVQCFMRHGASPFVTIGIPCHGPA